MYFEKEELPKNSSKLHLFSKRFKNPIKSCRNLLEDNLSESHLPSKRSIKIK